MNKVSTHTILIVIFLSITAIAGAFGHFSQNMGFGQNETIIIVDVSGSVRDICNSLSNEIKQSFEESNQISIYATGRKHTGYEPYLIEQFENNSNSFLNIGNKKDSSTNRQDCLEKIQKKCEKRLSKIRDISPIFKSVKTITSMFKTRPCYASKTCKIRVITDGIETLNKAISKHIIKRRATIPTSIQLDNENIKIEICGFAQGNKRVNTSRLEVGWKSFFKHPENVTIRPFCNI